MSFQSFNTFNSFGPTIPKSLPPIVYTASANQIYSSTSVGNYNCISASDDGKYVLIGTTSSVLVSSNTGTSFTTFAFAKTFTIAWTSITGQYMFAQAAAGEVYVSSNYGVTWVDIGTTGGGNRLITIDATGQKMYWTIGTVLQNIVYYISNPAGLSANANIALTPTTLTVSGPAFKGLYSRLSGDGSMLYIAGTTGTTTVLDTIMQYVVSTNTLNVLASGANYGHSGNFFNQGIGVNYNGSCFVMAGSSYIMISNNYGATISLISTINSISVVGLCCVESCTSGRSILLGAKSGALSTSYYFVSQDYGQTWKSIALPYLRSVKICDDGSSGYMTVYNTTNTTSYLYKLA